ncbi:MAG: AAA family ATPase [Prevotella sp.]|nr:AAA family ATPase [Prevotella sp.]
MTIEEFILQVEHELGMTPTAEQHQAVDCFAHFLSDRNDQSLMILRGSAGTGKTTLASAMVRTLKRYGQKTVLLAPTGRAAKVFSMNSGQQAFTIHRRIYRQKSLDGGFGLGFNSARDTLFLVDEASMISGDSVSPFVDGGFSAGSLLDNLVSYVYGETDLSQTEGARGRGCRLLLIGDPAQLPPVGEQDAPALDASVMSGYGLKVYEATLNEVVRQTEESGILWNATQVRRTLEMPDLVWPQIRFNGFADVERVPGDELVESLASSYSKVGMDETMVVTRSNKRANVYNMGIRNMIIGCEEELSSGDLLMVVKNKYGISSAEEEKADANLTFIANGDRARVVRVRNIHEQYGFRFAKVWLEFPDYDDFELQSMVLLDTLTSEAPALTREQSDLLYEKVMEDYADIPLKADRLKKMKEDEYFNALQVKFAYAVTCHKAQGGQWAHVYIDQGFITEDMLTPDYIHWLYTALTRATEKLFLVNWKDNG